MVMSPLARLTRGQRLAALWRARLRPFETRKVRRVMEARAGHSLPRCPILLWEDHAIMDGGTEMVVTRDEDGEWQVLDVRF